MGTHDAYTRLLGLALRGGNLVTGSDAVQAAAYAGQIRLLMISADASPHVCRDAQIWSERGNCTLIALPCDKSELGGALGRGNVAVAALTNMGLAAAVAERLAQFDPERYTVTAERFKRKVERAGERKAAKARARPAKASGAANAGKRKSDVAARKPNAARKADVANAGKRKSDAADAGKRESDVAARKSGAARDDQPTRKPNAARKPSGTTRKPNAATRKPSAARIPAVKRKTDAEHDKNPGAARKSGGTARKSNAPTRKPNVTRGRAPYRAGNPRPRRKNTDT